MASPEPAHSHIPLARPRLLPRLIFASRWLQLPLYLGLIAAQGIFVWQFMVELWHLFAAALGDASALHLISQAMDPIPDPKIKRLDDTLIMLTILALIDVVMVSNLIFMIVIGGYETFVSRLHLEKHPDHPLWLGHVNMTVLKVKLAMAIIGISSIHLLKTFINAADYAAQVLLWQTVIHVVFLLSAMAIAYTDKLMHSHLHALKTDSKS
jgi:uncharacterized protein (TIGR00645 family)